MLAISPRRWCWAVVLAVTCALSASVASSAPPAPRDTDPRRARLRVGEPAAERGRRRASEPPPGAGARAERANLPLHIALTQPDSCPIPNHPALVRRLLRLSNRSQHLSLELWGDAHEYAAYQDVTYTLRAPRPVYVTLFWIGPRGDIFIPFQRLKIPSHRDVTVDPQSVIVPPLGKEQWVALATLEPIPLPCRGGAEAQLAALEAMLAVPHGVGRWEVRSATHAPR